MEPAPPVTGPAATCALLVPCHNGAAFLPRLFHSVRAQSRAFDEILLFDDASTDGSGEIAAGLGAKVLRAHTPLGPAAARNRLLAETACQWVHFHDADDALHPDFVARMMARAAAGNADVVLCQVDWIEEGTGRIVLRWRYDETVYQTERAAADMLVNIIGGIGGLYARDALRRAGGFREELRYWEDLDLHLRLWRAGARFRVEDAVLSLAYRHANSTSNSNLVKVWRAKSALLSTWLDDPILSPLVRHTTGIEAENILSRQLDLGDLAGARESLALAHRAGNLAPSTHNRFLRVFCRCFGPWAAIRLQHRVRRRAMTRRPSS